MKSSLNQLAYKRKAIKRKLEPKEKSAERILKEAKAKTFSESCVNYRCESGFQWCNSGYKHCPFAKCAEYIKKEN